MERAAHVTALFDGFSFFLALRPAGFRVAHIPYYEVLPLSSDKALRDYVRYVACFFGTLFHEVSFPVPL